MKEGNLIMEIEEFDRVFSMCYQIIDIGIKKGYFKLNDYQRLNNKFNQMIENGIEKDITGTAIYGLYVWESKPQKLHFNSKVFKDEQQALIYVIHEFKHALDDKGDFCGFQNKDNNKGVGINEGVTHKFATNMTEELLGVKIKNKKWISLGITVDTNLDEYQIEARLAEIFCKSVGIDISDFIQIQNEKEFERLEVIKNKFNQYANYDDFSDAVDKIYNIQAETWFSENGELLEEETKVTEDQFSRAKKEIMICQKEILKYLELSNNKNIDEIKELFLL